LWNPDGAEERAAVAGEMARLAERGGDTERLLMAHTLRVMDCLELGDLRGGDVAMAAVERLAQTLRQPQFLWYALTVRAMRGLLDGRVADAERLAAEALHVGLEQNPNAPLIYGAQIFACRLAQGRVGELEGTVEMLARQAPDLSAWSCTRAYIHSQTGREAEARAELERLVRDDFAALRRDGNWMQAMVQLAVVSTACGAVTEAALLYDRLLPYADRNVLVAGAAVCAGAVAHWLGELAALLARWDDAERHFDAALRRHEQMGAPALLAYSRYSYAQMLLLRRQPGEAAHARELLEAAAQTYRTLEMPGFAARAERLLTPDASAAVPASAEANARETLATTELPPGSEKAVNVLRREGDFWTIIYLGTVARLKDAKGIRYLAQLLREPGREFHVADLVRAVEGVPEGLISRQRHGRGKALAEDGLSLATAHDAKLLPDPRAVGEYRRRLEDLREGLDEAERFNDVERASRTRAEIEFLTGELGAAYGMGVARSAVAPVEKLRKAVGNRLRGTLGRIQQTLPSLGRHLGAALKLGTFCSYCPDPAVRWDVQ
jgi:tetratricopeptide (TPR) repeat protein